jgi:excisionase family DNA binding protein
VKEVISKMNSLISLMEEHNKLIRLQKDVLTISEASTYSGLSISRIYHLTSERVIKHSKPSGKQIFIRVEDLIEYLLQNPVATNTEINQKAINKFLNEKAKE